VNGAGASEAGDLLIRIGGICGGSIALGVAIALVLASVAKDLGANVNQWELAERGGSLGALFGIVFAVAEQIGWG
jgi:hypothetical protein